MAHVERGNESNPHDEWFDTYCGLESTKSPLTNDEKLVSCKKCLNAIANEKLANKPSLLDEAVAIIMNMKWQLYYDLTVRMDGDSEKINLDKRIRTFLEKVNQYGPNT